MFLFETMALFLQLPALLGQGCFEFGALTFLLSIACLLLRIPCGLLFLHLCSQCRHFLGNFLRYTRFGRPSSLGGANGQHLHLLHDDNFETIAAVVNHFGNLIHAKLQHRGVVHRQQHVIGKNTARLRGAPIHDTVDNNAGPTLFPRRQVHAQFTRGSTFHDKHTLIGLLGLFTEGSVACRCRSSSRLPGIDCLGVLNHWRTGNDRVLGIVGSKFRLERRHNLIGRCLLLIESTAPFHHGVPVLVATIKVLKALRMPIGVERSLRFRMRLRFQLFRSLFRLSPRRLDLAAFWRPNDRLTKHGRRSLGLLQLDIVLGQWLRPVMVGPVAAGLLGKHGHTGWSARTACRLGWRMGGSGGGAGGPAMRTRCGAIPLRQLGGQFGYPRCTSRLACARRWCRRLVFFTQRQSVWSYKDAMLGLACKVPDAIHFASVFTDWLVKCNAHPHISFVMLGSGKRVLAPRSRMCSRVRCGHGPHWPNILDMNLGLSIQVCPIALSDRHGRHCIEQNGVGGSRDCRA
eukprot:m.77927 g.77927  ORF g.77927 m.77927 type:complete len:516 (-) comp9176_c0_seq1:90-1637(-)